MGKGLRVALIVGFVATLAGCQYADLDPSPADEAVDTAPAYQVYLRPRFNPVSATPILTKQLIVIRDRLTGDERIVDSVLPVALTANVNTRIVTFGQFDSAPPSNLTVGSRSRITQAQNRRLLYLKGRDPLRGGQLWELTLDDREAPVRRISLDDNICNLFGLTYDFSKIAETAVLYALPGPAGGDCEDANERPLRQVRLSFDENQRPIFLGDSFRALGRPLRGDGSVIRRLVDIELSDDIARSDLASCPFSFIKDRSECKTIKTFDNLDGCRRQDGCPNRPVIEGERTCAVDEAIRTLQDKKTRDCDLSVRTLPGPSYRLANQFFRVGRLDDQMKPTQGMLTLYRGDQTPVPVSPFIDDIYRFKTQYRRSGYINRESTPEVTISASPGLDDTMVVVAGTGQDPTDLVLFSDGNKLNSLSLKVSNSSVLMPPTQLYPQIPAEGEPVATKWHRCRTHRRLDSASGGMMVEGDFLPGGEILDVRTLGEEVVFRWCGPLDLPECAAGNAVCNLQRNSCPQEALNRKQVLYAVPMTGGSAVELDCVEGGTLGMNVLTSTAWTYNVMQQRGADRSPLRSEQIRREARVLSVDRNRRVVSRPLLPPSTGEDFDGSSWLSDVQLADEDDGTPTSVVSQKLAGAGNDVDFDTNQSYVIALRNRRNRDTELFALDLANPDVSTAVAIGTVTRRADLRDHRDCERISRPSGKTLPGATAGRVSGYGRQALIELTIPRSAGFRFPIKMDGHRIFETIDTLSDTDIYAADLRTPGSLHPVSTTPPPPSPGKRVFCPSMDKTKIPNGMNAANDMLIAR